MYDPPPRLRAVLPQPGVWLQYLNFYRVPSGGAGWFCYGDDGDGGGDRGGDGGGGDGVVVLLFLLPLLLLLGTWSVIW